MRTRSWILVVLFSVAAVVLAGGDHMESHSVPHMRIVFSSMRDRPAFASLYVYDLTDEADGKIIHAIPQATDQSHTNGSLTNDGRTAMYTLKQVGGFVPSLQLYDADAPLPLGPVPLPSEIPSLTHARLSGDSKTIAFCIWESPGNMGGWDVMILDRINGKYVEAKGLNSGADEREPALNADASRIAFVSNRPGGIGLSDIYLFERSQGKLLETPGLNSPGRDVNPMLSADGRWLTFSSDRPGGRGGLDVYLYDLTSLQLVEMQPLNSVSHDQSPVLSADGRFILFVSERVGGAGNRDLFLYDTLRKRFLETPDLNSPADEFDPALQVITR